MGDFHPGWLALREPADAAARCESLLAPLAAWIGRGPRLGPLEILDLGCGAGANPRWLAPRLDALTGVGQRWICVDRDPELLGVLPEACTRWAGGRGMGVSPDGPGLRLGAPSVDWTIETRALDLAGGLPADLIPVGALTAATALLDLVSEDWLEGLVAACAGRASPLLATLIYDGRVTLSPSLPLDGPVIALVNGHQRRDKGLGPALGPSAAPRLMALGKAQGLMIHAADSDWVLDTGTGDLQLGLIEGWAAAALEQSAISGARDGSRLSAPIADWLDARRRAVEEGRSRIQVGHRDVLLLPP